MRRRFRRIAAVVAVAIVIMLVVVGTVICRVSENPNARPGETANAPEPTSGSDQDAVATPGVTVGTVVEGVTPQSTSASIALCPSGARTAEPREPAFDGAEGSSRHNPYAFGATAKDPEWEITVLQSLRGNEAWERIIRAGTPGIDRHIRGREFVLIEISAAYVGDEQGEIGLRHFGITGASGVLWVPSRTGLGPDPILDVDETVPTGERIQRWLLLHVTQDERDLVLVFTTQSITVRGHGQMHASSLAALPMGFGGRGAFGGGSGRVAMEGAKYFALSTDTSVPLPPSWESRGVATTPSQPDNPIRSGRHGVVAQVEVRVLEVLRGMQAAELIRSVDRYYDPPSVGWEYVVLRVCVGFRSATGDPIMVTSGIFGLLDDGGEISDRPDVTTPWPWIDAVLYPGGVNQGWVALQAQVYNRQLTLVVRSPFDPDEKERIYLEIP